MKLKGVIYVNNKKLNSKYKVEVQNE